jgi:3-hydroxyanthranilate 3,4-dioxygenase
MQHTPLPAWLAAARPSLQPPVCNKMLYASPRGLQVMVVGGPNQRSDFHLESGEELFLQLEGGMVLRVEERGALRDIAIGQGQAFLLPPHIPHSPQRGAGTLGLVVERARRAGDGQDGLRWYAAGGSGTALLYEETFHCTDLATQLGPVIARFRASEQARTGVPDAAAPASPLRVDREAALGEACALEAWPQGQQQPRDEFQVRVARGAGCVPVALGQAELFVYLVRGRCAVRSGGGADAAAAWEQPLVAGDTLVVPPATPSGQPTGTVQCEFDAEALCLMVHY